MKTMDGEKMWRDVINSVPERARHRYHRLNITFEDQEPAIDDVAAMEDLESMTESQLRAHPERVLIVNSMLASMFYFEFEEVPLWDGRAFLCRGIILVRTRLPIEGRRALLDELADTSSFFLIRGVPVVCVPKRTKSVPPYKCPITFQLESLDDIVAITLRGITSEPCTISGLPRSAAEIVSAQGLQAHFGKIDHVAPEKPLPRRPLKRKRAAVESVI